MENQYNAQIFSTSFIQQLAQLRLLIKKNLGSNAHGGVSTKSRGVGDEFNFHLPYNPGDDFKHIDWNIYARTEQFYIKQYRQNKHFAIKIFVDLSASMIQGNPRKIDMAKKFAAGIAYLFLYNGCSIQIGIMQNDSILYSKLYRHSKYIKDIFTFLSQHHPQGAQSLGNVIQKIPRKRSQMYVLISDFFHAPNSFAAIRQLAANNRTLLLHLCAVEDIMTSLSGSFTLRDIESNEKMIVRINADTRQQYTQQTRKFREYWQSFASQYRIPYYFALNNHDVISSIASSLRHANLLQIR
ncbi:DUF58 domain-containing protein [Candidatus Uabimicrobium amorphum]|uniref:DUF58 domain-containing protein n=1 Tax=Uabimicrobium amorphum TaxID=2596890 RepID=A0A5S9F1G2_UABAM|nr:DUF58 domain-containing protein [Candidatus Uabimicrobium amorphum]BBM82536.1 hypothetical protein UABAM_00879 [Candidatus Uabimicrobium amorphum]